MHELQKVSWSWQVGVLHTTFVLRLLSYFYTEPSKLSLASYEPIYFSFCYTDYRTIKNKSAFLGHNTYLPYSLHISCVSTSMKKCRYLIFAFSCEVKVIIEIFEFRQEILSSKWSTYLKVKKFKNLFWEKAHLPFLQDAIL